MLSAGYHAFTATYFERNGDQEFRVAYADALEAAQNNPRLRRALNAGYLTPAPAPTPAPVLAINAGGGAVGRFQADQSFGGLGGAPAGIPSASSFNFDPLVSGFDLAPAAVYQSQREAAGTGYFVYSIRSGLVEGQSYRLRLHFSEQTFAAAGERQFNVVLNGTTTLLANFDIAATVGNFRAVVREFTFTARPASSSTGNLFLRFDPGAAGKPIVNGIEILPLPAPTPAPVARQALATARTAGADETVLLYPNPARDQLTVHLQAGVGEDVRVDVLDALARRVAGTALRASAGWNDVRLPLGALPGGVYSVAVQRGAERIVRRLVVAP